MKDDNETIIKHFKAVDFMRKTRDKISKDIADMTFEEIQAYFENRRRQLSETRYKAQ